MLKRYIAAGFDPARFWKITPRLFVLEMDGASQRLQRERSNVWWGALLARMDKPPTHEAFTGAKPDRTEQIKRWAEAWDKVDRALSRNRVQQ